MVYRGIKRANSSCVCLCVCVCFFQSQSRRPLHARSFVATAAPVFVLIQSLIFSPYPHARPLLQLPSVGFEPMGFVPRESTHALLVWPNPGANWFGVRVYHRLRQTRCFESLDPRAHLLCIATQFSSKGYALHLDAHRDMTLSLTD